MSRSQPITRDFSTQHDSLLRQASKSRVLIQRERLNIYARLRAAFFEENDMGKTNDDMALCYHEAGHAVLAWLFKVRFEGIYVDLVAGRGHLEFSGQEFASKSAWSNYLNRKAHSAAGGPRAESLFWELIGEPKWNAILWSSSDYRHLNEFIGGPCSFDSDSHPASRAVSHVIRRDDVQHAIAALAGVLYAKKEIKEAEAVAIIKTFIPKRTGLYSAAMEMKNAKISRIWERHRTNLQKAA